jgi:predicted nucleotidyltransferase
MAEQDIIESIQRYMRAVEDAGIPVSCVVLYGSQAQGNTHQWSDIDLIVVSPRFDGSKHREDIGTLWYAAAQTDSRIEPIACGLKQWRDDTSSAIIEIARREGQLIRAA